MTSVLEQTFVIDCESESLVAVLHPARTEALAQGIGVVIVVGGPQYRVGSHRQFVLTARAFANAGFPVLRLDLRGMGDGVGPQRSFERTAADIRCAIDALCAAVPGTSGIALLGWCDGASAAMVYAPLDRRVTHLILANPWVRTGHTAASTVLRYYYVRRILQRSFWAKLLRLRLNPLRAAGDLAENLRGAVNRPDGTAAANYVDRMRDGLAAFRGKSLCVISGQDLTAKEFVALINTNREWRTTVARAAFARVDFPSADHTFSTRTDLDAMNDRCIRWLGSAVSGLSP